MRLVFYGVTILGIFWLGVAVFREFVWIDYPSFVWGMIWGTMLAGVNVWAYPLWKSQTD